LVEKYPADYDGVVILAGMIGGTAQQLDNVTNVRILFDFFYPGALPGSVLDVPEGYSVPDLINAVLPAVMADPTGVFLMSLIDQVCLPAPTNEDLVQSLITALGFNIRGIGDVLERTHAECPIDNMDTVYTSSSGVVPAHVLEALNALVQRYDRTDGAEAELRRNYEPSGRLATPLIAIHRRWDPTVSLCGAERYRKKVIENGREEFFELRIIEEYGHSDFLPELVASALSELVARFFAAAPLARL
jgi:hypothetical protein